MPSRSAERFRTALIYDPSELKLLLTKELPEFTRNLTEKMLTYALGRGLEGYDKLLVRETVAKMEKSDYKFQTLVREIANSLPFQARRGQLSTQTEVASK